jgi:hypothetical protein
MCRSAGFAQVELLDVTNQRASVVCKRHWPEPDLHPKSPAPQLHAVINNRTYVSTFHPNKDEYLCCYFKSEEAGLTVDSLFVEVDGFGTHALIVAENGKADSVTTGYQANCLRPPGLQPGKHEVRIRTAKTGRSNPAVFMMLDESGQEVFVPSEHLPAAAPELCSAEFQPSGDLRFAVNKGGSLVCYFRSPAESVAARDVTIEIAGRQAPAHTISFLGENVWQANLLLLEPLTGEVFVRLRLGEGEWSTASPAHGTVT